MYPWGPLGVTATNETSRKDRHQSSCLETEGGFELRNTHQENQDSTDCTEWFTLLPYFRTLHHLSLFPSHTCSHSPLPFSLSIMNPSQTSLPNTLFYFCILLSMHYYPIASILLSLTSYLLSFSLTPSSSDF